MSSTTYDAFAAIWTSSWFTILCFAIAGAIAWSLCRVTAPPRKNAGIEPTEPWPRGETVFHHYDCTGGERKIDVTLKVNSGEHDLPRRDQKINLMYQGRCDGTVEAFEINGMMVIGHDENGVVYVTRDNAKEFFGLVEKT